MPTLPAQLESITSRGWSRDEAFDYCGRLARTHYENFHLGSFLFPGVLRPHLHAIYAYCRWADDLADEAVSPDEGRAHLDRFAEWIESTYAGSPPSHPVFVALSDTVRRFDVPKRPFLDLLIAFRWDLEKNRWASTDELLEYCVYSANPVGRLFLALFLPSKGEPREPSALRLSDATCTALQLANHWQDVARDLRDRDRIYLPQENLARHGLCDDDLRSFLDGRAVDDRWRGLLKEEVARARDLFRTGEALLELLPPRLRVDVRLFTLGGWAILDRIEAQGYDIFRRRPSLGAAAKTGILLKALVTRRGRWA